MAPCSQFGSIKSRCLKLTDKKQFPSSICAVYWLLYRQCKQPLRYLNKSRPVFPQLILYCQRGLHLEAGAYHYIVLCLHSWLCYDLVFLLQPICSLSCTIMSFLFKFKKHDKWSNIQPLICQTSCLWLCWTKWFNLFLEIFLFKQSHSSCTKNITDFKRCLAVLGYASSVWTSTTKFPI